jgi:hypothetical protein
VQHGWEGIGMKLRAPQTPSELLQQLQSVFPDFEEESKDGHASDRLNFHAVLMDFRPFYSRHVTEFNEKQLKALAAIVNAAAASADTLANAFDTCFFERMGPQTKALRPFLNAKAKGLSRGHRS